MWAVRNHGDQDGNCLSRAPTGALPVRNLVSPPSTDSSICNGKYGTRGSCGPRRLRKSSLCISFESRASGNSTIHLPGGSPRHMKSEPGLTESLRMPTDYHGPREGWAMSDVSQTASGPSVFIVRSSAAGGPQLRPESLPPRHVSPQQPVALSRRSGLPPASPCDACASPSPS
jgi:hypothetical protein